ncbi:MAG: multiheme c-type cytochrome [Myxococcota bacterium]
MKTRRVQLLIAVALLGLAALVTGAAFVEPYSPEYDAEYVGSAACGKCHTGKYERWKHSPHAKMTRRPTPESVVGNFRDGQYILPKEGRKSPLDEAPVARMYREGERYFMALRHPRETRFVPFEIEWVIGFQHRQVYLTREPGGVLRRMPLQWSVPRQEYFSYWNLQEGSTPTLEDLWSQMGVNNSAWNLFCARCHTTNLEVLAKDPQHRTAQTEFLEPGIACEACHGPGSLHIEYFGTNYANRVASFLGDQLEGARAAYIASAPKLEKGQSLSVCGRCHGTDILMATTDIYRTYEPGFSRTGRTNDLSRWFRSTPLTPNRKTPTVEVWADGRPRGIGMVFRSLIESACYQKGDVRCQSCHDPHDNHEATVPGLLEASEASDAWCLGCHQDLGDLQAHTHHPPESSGARCYGCHLPRTIEKITNGVPGTTRTHELSSIPKPENTVRYGEDGAPNACNLCHEDQSPEWALEKVRAWYTAPRKL